MTDRRTFIKQTAAVTASFLVSPTMAHSKVHQSQDRQLCFFTKHLQWLDFEDTATVMRDAGFDGADLTVRRGGHIEPTDATTELPRAIAAFQKKGLTIPMAATNVKESDDPQLDSYLKALADNGIKYYRMAYLDYDHSRSMDQNSQYFKEVLKALAAKNERYGLCGGYQNHAGSRLGASIWDLKIALEGIDPQYLSCQFDVRHAAFEGMRSWINDMRVIQPHIRTTALKDFKWADHPEKRWSFVNVPLGQGVVDFKKYFELFNPMQGDAPITVHAEYELFTPEEEQLPKPKKMDLAISRLSRDVSFAKKHLSST